MLLSHRLGDYAANPVASSGGTNSYIGFSTDTTFPAGIQVNDVVVQMTIRNVTGPGTTPGGYSNIYKGVMASVGWASFDWKFIDSTDVSSGVNSGYAASTNLLKTIQWVFRVPSVAPGAESHTALSVLNSSGQNLTGMTGSTTGSGLVLGIAGGLGTFTQSMNINADSTNAMRDTYATLAWRFHSPSETVTTTNARMSSSNSYLQALWIIYA